jgi:hypothetical protein
MGERGGERGRGERGGVQSLLVQGRVHLFWVLAWRQMSFPGKKASHLPHSKGGADASGDGGGEVQSHKQIKHYKEEDTRHGQRAPILRPHPHTTLRGLDGDVTGSGPNMKRIGENSLGLTMAFCGGRGGEIGNATPQCAHINVQDSTRGLRGGGPHRAAHAQPRTLVGHHFVALGIAEHVRLHKSVCVID